MKFKKIFKYVVSLSTLFTLFVLTSRYSYSWFGKDNQVTFENDIGTTQANYYESGDGSKEHPFIISNGRHFYNLAWLQYLGTYNTTKNEDGSLKQYYFELKNDIDLSNYVLPPVGSEEYPFISNFDAKNYTIKNLTISNVIDTGYIENYPSIVNKDTFNSKSAIVGVFGVVGSYTSDSTTTYDSSINEVKNLYLDNLTIRTKKDNLLVGIFAGYVNGTIDNCGVHYAKIEMDGKTSKISKFSAVSEYTLIGSYNKDNYKWDEDPDSSSSSGDAGYGTSTNIRALHTELTNFGFTDSDGNGIVKAGYAMPFQADSSSSIISSSGTTTINSKTVTNASTVAVNSSTTNIGYYVGGTINSSYDSTATIKVMKDHYSTTDIKVDYDNIQVSSNSDVTTVPDRVKTYLSKSISDDIKQGDSVIKLTTPNLLYDTMGKDNGYYLIPGKTENGKYTGGKVGDYEGNIYIPNNCIWVAPLKAGTFEFVAVNENTGTSYLAIWKLKRSTPKDYSSSLSTPSYNQRDNFGNYPSADFVGMGVSSYSSTGKKTYTAYYYGTPVSQDDIDNGVEFAVTLYGNPIIKNPVYITYMDIGSDGGGSGTDTDSKTAITSFDFVTKESDGSLTKIKTYNSTSGEYEENSSYSKSNITFKISDTTSDTSILAFRRIDQTTNGVLYYQSVTNIVTPSGKGYKKETSNEDCNS